MVNQQLTKYLCYFGERLCSTSCAALYKSCGPLAISCAAQKKKAVVQQQLAVLLWRKAVVHQQLTVLLWRRAVVNQQLTKWLCCFGDKLCQLIMLFGEKLWYTSSQLCCFRQELWFTSNQLCCLEEKLQSTSNLLNVCAALEKSCDPLATSYADMEKSCDQLAAYLTSVLFWESFGQLAVLFWSRAVVKQHLTKCLCCFGDKLWSTHYAALEKAVVQQQLAVLLWRNAVVHQQLTVLLWRRAVVNQQLTKWLCCFGDKLCQLTVLFW